MTRAPGIPGAAGQRTSLDRAGSGRAGEPPGGRMGARSSLTGTAVRRRIRPVVRWVGRRRRWLAAACVGGAVACTVSVLAPAAGPTQPVLVAGHMLMAGQSIASADVAVRDYPVDLAPDGALPSVALAAGHRVTGAVRAGEPITESRLVGPSMAQGLTDRVAVPVRIADADAARLAHPGDHIDLLAGAADPVGTAIGTGESHSDPVSAPSLVLARDALVLVVPGPADQSSSGSAFGSGFGSAGALLVVAVPESSALQLAAATTPIQLLIRPSS